MFYFKRYHLRNYHFSFLLMIFLLSSISIMTLQTANAAYVKRQLMGIIAGYVILLIVSLVDYQWLLSLSWIIYIVSVGLLILVKVPGIGVAAKGATRWIDIGIQIQPSELAKISLILFWGAYIQKHEDDLNTLFTLVKLGALTALPLILILTQPNLSTTIIVFLLFCIIIFAGGLSWKIIIPVLAIAVPAVAAGLIYIQQPDQKLLEPYQAKRILGFIDPKTYSDTFYQQENSLAALASGGFYGNLDGENPLSVTDSGFLPESHTDFIFSVVGQDFGFIGTGGVILLLAGIVAMCLITAIRAPDRGGMLICCGMAGLISIQTILNISVATAMMPNTGVVLPFVSYGLTSLWSMFIGVGLVLNVGLHRRQLS